MVMEVKQSPQWLEKGNSKLIFLKGGKDDSGNSPLVSHIPVPAKIMEQILLDMWTSMCDREHTSDE